MGSVLRKHSAAGAEYSARLVFYHQALAGGQVHDFLWLVGKELVHRKSRARAGYEAVVVAKKHAARLKTRVKKFERIPCRLIEVDIHVNEAKLTSGQFIEPFGYPPSQDMDVVEFLQILSTLLLVYAQRSSLPE